jgi:hypothetical protein
MSATKAQAEFPVAGMTFASFVTRAEQRLNKPDGVQASVSHATEQASIDPPAPANGVSPEAAAPADEQVCE